MSISLTDKLVQLYQLWDKDPVLGVKQLFGVEPTEQQAELIRSAWSQRCRVAVSSCQGAGKTSALVWLTFLFLLTQDDCRILITSPSYQQLGRVFSSEIAKWHSKMPEVFRNQFIITKDKVALKGKEGFQFASMVTASSDNEENLQGGHSESYIILADEASGIDEHVFDLLLGTLGTGTGGRFILTSNPLRSSGRFWEIFGKELDGWTRHYFSAYEAPRMNPEWIEEMKETYGEDSDIFRVRVLGKFPRASTSQYFPADLIQQAQNNRVDEYIYGRYPRICGVDIARFGDDMTVFVIRQGPRILDITKFKGLDTMEVASKLFEYNTMWKPNTICVDSMGIGAGVYDRAKQLHLPVHQVVVAQKSTEPMEYANLRAQLYGLTKEWLQNGADIPSDKEVYEQFLSIEYGYNTKMQIQMVSKKDLKKRGIDSPDIVDAITLTHLHDAFKRVGVAAVKAREVKKANYLWS